MRHRKTVHKLSRNRDARRALLKGMAQDLILYEQIQTTEAKAKALRPYVERLITKGKADTLANRRYLLSQLPTENAVNKLLEVIVPRFKERTGGYTRIVKVGRRGGDNAPVVQLEFV